MMIKIKSNSIVYLFTFYFLLLCLVISLVFNQHRLSLMLNITILTVLAFVLTYFNERPQRLKALFLLMVIYIILISYLGLSKPMPNLMNKSVTLLEEINFTDYRYSIFFFESNYEREELTTKEMCAIESAAKNNPNALVQLHTYSATFGKKAEALLKIYENLKLIRFEPEKIFNETHMFEWWLNKDVFKSKFTFSHLTDAFRLSVLWKYGGVYSDLDTITLKSFEPLLNDGKSGFGDMKEREESIGTGILLFRAKHPFLEYAMKRFSKNYSPDIWGANGPLLIIQSAKEFCQIDNIHRSLFGVNYSQLSIKNKTNQSDLLLNNCADLRIFPQSYFYPILYVDGGHEKIFEKCDECKTKIRDSYSMHYYGALSSRFQPRADDVTSSFFSYVAANHCDFTFNYVKELKTRFY